MFTKTSVKKLTIVLAALLVCAALLFAACNPAQSFTPRTVLSGKTPVGNGGIAVQYGEWLYYVNGNISSPTTADNSYTETLRSGAVVRIKLADLQSILKYSASSVDMSASEKNKELQRQVREAAEMVVPNVYYTANTDDASLNGIYIFGDRIYITTPNDKLDDKGDVLTSQLVLTSYNLGGGDRQRHVVFESNKPLLKLAEVDGSVYATYVLDRTLYSYKVGDSEPAKIAEEITSQQVSGNNFFYLNKDGSICRYTVGAKEATELVPLIQPEGHEDHNHNSYTIQKVNGDYVYYTYTSSESIGKPDENGQVLFGANTPVENDEHHAVIHSIPSSYYCYGDKVYFTDKDAKDPEQSQYLLLSAYNTGNRETVRHEKGSITLQKLVGSVLYYQVSSVTYTLDLAVEGAEPVPYALNYNLSASGWAYPDVLTVGTGEDAVTYMFTLGIDSISVVTFNPTTLKNTSATSILLVAEK